MKIKDFLLKHDKIYLPFVADNFGLTMERVRDEVVGLWDKFNSPQIVENMLVTNYEDKCNYYEICDTKYNRGKSLHEDKIWEHCYYNDGADQHISVFKHDSKWLDNYKRSNSVSCRDTWVSADWIYLELDRERTIDAITDALEFYRNFPYQESVVMWHSGNTSVHIAVHTSLFGSPTGKQENICGLGKLYYNLAHKLFGDIRHRNGIKDPWLLNDNELYKAYYETFGELKGDLSVMKQELENIDPNLFKVNSLIRQPWSLHEKTDQPKSIIDDNGLIIRNKKLDFNKNFPYLIHWINECYEPRYKKTPHVKVPDLEDSIVLKVYKDVEGFDMSQADRQGWINNLYSPFYKDENPSVAINVKTGFYKDFGEPTHSFGIVEFYAKLNDITNEQAKKEIREN